MIGESISNAIDHTLVMRGATINLSLIVQEDGGLAFEVGSDQLPAGGEATPAAQRLIDAFASQLNARVVREPGNPVFTRIIVPVETEAAPSTAAPTTPAATRVG
jgi:hypothetical protein